MWAACCVFLCSYIVFLLLALVMISSSLNTNIQFSMQITRKITSVSSRVDKRPSTIQSQTFLHLSVFFTCQTLHCLSVCVCVCVCVGGWICAHMWMSVLFVYIFNCVYLFRNENSSSLMDTFSAEHQNKWCDIHL